MASEKHAGNVALRRNVSPIYKPDGKLVGISCIGRGARLALLEGAMWHYAVRRHGGDSACTAGAGPRILCIVRQLVPEGQKHYTRFCVFLYVCRSWLSSCGRGEHH